MQCLQTTTLFAMRTGLLLFVGRPPGAAIGMVVALGVASLVNSDRYRHR